MDCTIYEWEVRGEAAAVPHGPDARAALGRDLKRVFPVVVDDKFIEMLRALDGPTAR